MSCKCFIVPQDVLQRFARDPELSEEVRRNFAFTAAVTQQIRAVREKQAELSVTLAQQNAISLPSVAGPSRHSLPPGSVYDANCASALPGTLISSPGTSTDGSAKRAYTEAEAVAEFYWEVFQRDSIDGHHMPIVSTVHYLNNFNNAFWNGTQMVYGDGDRQIFLDFTLANDVIGHELTHGVTQHSLGLSYVNEAGGLNESISDVFGSMFRQWQAKQDVNAADWLIGSNIMGPVATAKGYTCLRDMADPAAAHALAPQPTNFSQYHAGMDPHYSSGIPNLAFCKAAKAAGGHSWDKVGKIWYKALTGSSVHPNMSMKQFANVTRKLSLADQPLHHAISTAWVAVGL